MDIIERFGLSQEEELMESFEVELRQAYSCSHNTLSKHQEVRCSSSFLGLICAVALRSRGWTHLVRLRA